jgi:uncharacterized protein YndB with AHSA1/START domain
MNEEKSIVARVDIDASRERVWEMLCDVGRYAEWVESTLKVTRSDGPAQLGGTYEEVTRVSGPWKTTTRWRVVKFEPLVRQEHSGEGVVTAQDMAVIMELSDVGDKTHLELVIRYAPRFGVVGRMIDAAVEGSLRRAQQRSAEAFARLVVRESSSR